MSKPDNHIDETLEDILFEYENGQNPHQDEDYRFERTKAKLDQHYADFYRNKIPEKVVWVKNVLNWNRSYVNGFNQAIDDITAQFNKGDK